MERSGDIHVYRVCDSTEILQGPIRSQNQYSRAFQTSKISWFHDTNGDSAFTVKEVVIQTWAKLACTFRDFLDFWKKWALLHFLQHNLCLWRHLARYPRHGHMASSISNDRFKRDTWTVREKIAWIQVLATAFTSGSLYFQYTCLCSTRTHALQFVMQQN